MANRHDDIPDAERRNREFIVLLGRHELQVAACIHALVPRWQDAEDILQETRLQLWQEFDKFQPGTDFLAWARTVARYMVRTHYKKNSRKPLLLCEEIENLVMAKISETPGRTDRRLEILADCVKKLGEDAVKLIHCCYAEKRKIKDIASEMGRSLAGTYSALSRIRGALYECMRESLRREEKQ